MSAPVRRRAVRRYVPPQHGAWAMLLLPFLAGVLVAGPRWVHLPLLIAWLGGYLWSYYALLAVKTGRPGRVRDQLLLYGAVTAAAGLAVVAARPGVVVFAPVYAALLAVNVGYARRRRERSLINDLASVAQSCVMVFVVAFCAGAPPASVWPAFVAVLLYFVGTVLHVKTMIRERGSVAYRRASVAYHALALAVAAWLGPAFAVVFGLLLVRAIVSPRLSLTPKRVGITEIVASVLVLAAAATG
ncbi:YwiC-like family protein [Luedemannella helvata]|uniref:YwiC-like family protein n=1 Tax=Luedemannella helvata TaxID=349315 RepID=A0ABP4WYE2_9ACTN